MGKSREQKVHDTVKRRLDHARNYWAPDNEMYGRTLDFCLFLNHYKNDPGFTRDKRRIQPKTQRQFNLIRHKASLLLRQMPEFDTRAVQPGADAHAAEVSRRIIEEIFHDPLKVYHDARSRMVWSALAGGRGTIAIEWHKRWGVCFQFRDPRRIHISPGNTFMHSVFNDAVYEEVPMRWSAVQRMGWDIPKDLAPDGGMFEHSMAGDREADGIEKEEASHLPGADEHDTSDPVVTIGKAWFREDPYRKVPSKLENADLPEEEWHFVDDALGVRYPWDPTNPIPPMSEATGQPMRLVTRRDEMFDAPSTDDKGYLVIIAPHYHGRKPLYEGTWMDGALNPDAYLSSFPYMELTCYKHPLRRTGLSDTEATVSLTVIDNQSVRSTYEQMRTAGGVLVTQAGALEDSEGNQFKFSDDPIAIAYAKDRLSLESTNFFQAPGMNAAMPAFRNMIESQWQHIGTGDFAGSLGPDRSKDIAVGTANMLQQTGDLPVQLHAQDLSAQEAIGARIALDYCCGYMGDNVVGWVTDEGEQASMVVRGSDLVPLNVTVRANKEWRQQDVDRVQATAQLLGMISKLMLPPPAIAVLLKDAGLSPSVTEALVGAMQQPQQPPPGGPSSGGPPNLEVVPGSANEINGAQRR